MRAFTLAESVDHVATEVAEGQVLKLTEAEVATHVAAGDIEAPEGFVAPEAPAEVPVEEAPAAPEAPAEAPEVAPETAPEAAPEVAPEAAPEAPAAPEEERG